MPSSESTVGKLLANKLAVYRMMVANITPAAGNPCKLIKRHCMLVALLLCLVSRATIIQTQACRERVSWQGEMARRKFGGHDSCNEVLGCYESLLGLTRKVCRYFWKALSIGCFKSPVSHSLYSARVVLDFSLFAYINIHQYAACMYVRSKGQSIVQLNCTRPE